MIGIAERTLRKVTKGQKGQALAIVLVLLGVGGMLLIPTLGLGFSTLKGHQAVEWKELEFYAADSGVEDSLYWLLKGRPAEGPWAGWDEDAGSGERQAYTINGRTVNVSVQRLPEANTYKITSEAVTASGKTTVLSTVWAITYFPGGQVFDNQDPPPEGDIWVDGDATIGGNIEVSGNFIATGSVTNMNHATITGDLLILGDITLDNNCEIYGTVCCGGDMTLGNGCTIYGDIHLLGEDCSVTLTESGAEIEGNIWADGNLTIDIDANAQIVGSSYTPGDTYDEPTGNTVIYLWNPNARITGDVYAIGSITILKDNGTLPPERRHASYSGPDPFDCPGCPGFPDRKASIYTYR